MVTIQHELPCDIPAREALLDRVFGLRRYRKTSSRLREDRLPANGLAFSALDENDRLIGTVRLWNVMAGSAGPALLLGPIAVDGRWQNKKIGHTLMEKAINDARLLSHRAILLVGDLPYYARFGFTREAAADLRLPGPVDCERFLGLELVEGALDGAEGLVTASGQCAAPAPELRQATTA